MLHFLSHFSLSYFDLISRETDRDVVGAAASIFIVSSVKIASQTTDLIKSEMHHQLPDQRINALLRFQVRFFYWGAMHAGWFMVQLEKYLKSICRYVRRDTFFPSFSPFLHQILSAPFLYWVRIFFLRFCIARFVKATKHVRNDLEIWQNDKCLWKITISRLFQI